MITRWDVEKYAKKDNAWFVIDENGAVCFKDTGKVAENSVEDFVVLLNKINHSWFECIYHCHGTLDTVYRCKECGTVIFTGDDERYNPNLCCPVCTGEKQRGEEYWTVEDIEKDEKKQNTLKFYQDWKEAEERDYERQKKTGLYHDEIWKKDVMDKKTGKCKKRYTLKWMHAKYFKDDKRSYGLYLEIIYMKEVDGMTCHDKTKKIPLSFYAWKVLKRIKNNKKKNIENNEEN